MIEKSKAVAEGAAAERKIVLGWMLHTRKLEISLPKHKYIGWTNLIDELLSYTIVSNKTLLSVLGRLENLAQTRVTLGHF